MKEVVIYTDGSCLGNPGPGGWAAILLLKGTEYRREICGGCRLTTNNRMEVRAALEALGALKAPCSVELFTDSQYLRNAVEKGWLASWQKNSWCKADKKPVLNADLWQQFIRLAGNHTLRLRWLKAHEGQAENERCDQLARTCARQPDLPADTDFEKAMGQTSRHAG